MSFTNREKTTADMITPCNCIGPQNGEPACPCAMRARKIYQRNGRWYAPEQDLGPVITVKKIDCEGVGDNNGFFEMGPED